MRRLSPTAQEGLRLRVVAAMASGQVRTYEQAAETFGVSERSVGTWWRAYQVGGRDALLAKKRQPRAGMGELIGKAERSAILQAMRDYTPADIGQTGVMWTRASVRALIRIVTRVTMTEQGVGKWLRRHGFTPQRPARRSYQQQDDQVRAWLDEQYPAIAARAKAEKAELVWADQCGLRSDTAPPGRSWAPAGQTPVVRVNGKRFKVNVMSAVASRGALWFTVFPGKFNATVFCTFLDRLARQAGRKAHVIADRHPVHRSKAVKQWLAANAERIELHLMPGYSPELNPDELLNADLKRHINAGRTTSADHLAHETRRFLRRRQRQPRIVCGYFKAPHVCYAIM
ncbi:IS630 family transposase [Kitasatospora sp. NPDC057542]|uniref:IS630 family transposase n=1 Tax=Kitasatospora sp. NPDC057542 TaxID=3346162 RepID=UPI0036C6EC0A